jgi:hypothetical protein
MDRDEAARAFLARIHDLVSDYISGNAPAGPLPRAIRRVWAEESIRRNPAGLDTSAIRLFALRQFADIDLSWPAEKPPSVQTLQGALKQVVELCNEPRAGASRGT